MESRIRKKFDNYVTTFKNDLKNKMNELEMLNTDKEKELLQFIFEYERIKLINDDFSKRKRLKNIVPVQDRCSANKACNEQCTRKRKEGFDFCGTHIKGTPNGIVDKCQTVDAKRKVVLKLTTNRGIYNYVDDDGKIYKMEDIMNMK
tara:strand:+ start:1202 stop:1642 length:441 start_codon:yes stop_codon:yes gene_type:complete